jgi:uncharacterized OB-fold protein
MTDRFTLYPGTPLSEADFETKAVLFNHDELHGEYAWDTGIAIRRYLDAFKQGVILGARCSQCQKTVVPPRIVCEWCYQPIDEFIHLQETGTVNTFSLCYVTWDVQRIEEPEIPAVIEIDGASPLHGLLHKLGEVDPQSVRIGMRVQAVWKKPQERTGAITDIRYFKPIREGER